MNTRNVFLLIIGTVFISVSSALIAVRLTQSKTAESSQVQTQFQSQALPPSSGPIQIAPSKDPIPPPPVPVPPKAIPAQTKALAEVMANLPPPSRDPIPDSRKPLSVEDVKKTLLKNAPACNDDYEDLCRKDVYLAEHPLACLRSKKEQISHACLNQVTAIQDTFKKVCGADIMKFCATKNRYFPCLKEKYAELTPECKKNILESSRQ